MKKQLWWISHEIYPKFLCLIHMSHMPTLIWVIILNVWKVSIKILEGTFCQTINEKWLLFPKTVLCQGNQVCRFTWTTCRWQKFSTCKLSLLKKQRKHIRLHSRRTSLVPQPLDRLLDSAIAGEDWPRIVSESYCGVLIPQGSSRRLDPLQGLDPL